MKIIYRVEALADLNDQLSYIAADSPTIAAQVAARIENSLSRLELFPHSGRAGAVPGTYELVVPRLPFIVVYRVTGFVEIIAVFHAAQKREPEDIARRVLRVVIGKA